jgi:RimJ/RimL family protein N-acetyltransferase
MTEGEDGRLALRLAGPGDSDELQRVFERAPDHFLRVTGSPEPSPDAAERELRAAAETEGRRVALVRPVEGADAVGALGWWAGHPEPDVALLGMLLIAQEARGRGLAREALGMLEGRLREEGISRMRTAVGAEDRTARRVLEALGFASMDRRAHVDMDGGRLRVAFFEKTL